MVEADSVTAFGPLTKAVNGRHTALTTKAINGTAPHRDFWTSSDLSSTGQYRFTH
jgi:hypothetical protein